jgi:hypothetical protein
MSEWTIDGEHLVHRKTGYDIPAHQLRDAEGCMRWLDHVREKRWASRQTMEDLLEAMAAIA